MQISYHNEYAVFFRAVTFDADGEVARQAQWLTMTGPRGDDRVQPRFLKREMSGTTRVRWRMTTRQSVAQLNATLVNQLESHMSMGWELEAPAVIHVDVDDYMKFYLGSAYLESFETDSQLFLTPYKALRQLSSTRQKHLGLSAI